MKVYAIVKTKGDKQTISQYADADELCIYKIKESALENIMFVDHELIDGSKENIYECELILKRKIT